MVVVIVPGCSADTTDQAAGTPADTPAGAMQPSDLGDETGVSSGASEKWQSVLLDGMPVDRLDPALERRNPFRFGTARTAEPDGDPVDVARRGPATGVESPGPSSSTRPRVSAPAGVTTSLALTFLGFLESPGIEGRVVVLTDGDLVFHGRVGDVIDGRYRIVGVDLESVEVEGIDGRGQETLRLSSQ
jgi:hypothetical protein